MPPRILFSIALAALLLFPWCADAQRTGSDLGAAVDRPIPEQSDVADVPGDPIEAILSALTLEQRVSQLMLVTFGGLYGPSDSDRRLMSDFPPGGVLVPHVTTPEDAAKYVQTLRGSPIEEEHGVPLLIGTNVFARSSSAERPSRTFFQLPTQLSLAATSDAEYAGQLADSIAEYLSVMGFNFHLGPALNLSSPMRNNEADVNALGSDPEFVAAFSTNFASALQKHSILWAPSGFPGGGASRVDGGPAVLLTPRSELGRSDLLPFVRSIGDGVPIIHVGNTLVPTLDSTPGPASLSPKVMGELLRELLGFRGLIVAGPLDARDMTIAHDPSEAALLAFNAGADMLYWKESGPHVAKAAVSLAMAVLKGELDEQVLNDRVRRILQFKAAHGLAERPMPIDKEAVKLGRKKDPFAASRTIERRGITLLKNAGNTLPLTESAASMPIGVTGIVGVEELHTALMEYIEPIAKQNIGTARHIGRIENFEIERLTLRARGVRTVVAVFSDVVDPLSQARVIRAFQDLGARVVVVLVGNPSILPELAEADAILLTYDNGDALARTMQSVADVLVGRAPMGLLESARDLHGQVGKEMTFSVYDVMRSPTGRLPIDIDDKFVVGRSINYTPTSAPKKVQWEFGDGKKSSGTVVAHTYKRAGKFPVTLRLTDPFGDTATQTYTVVVE
ncbi:MAG: PKD domain-containing protein [Candidatus Hydrogenedentes bacterium]|nr:PKD domain-containing protein [Candidatus Hydrogenedentota bacterium]